VSSPCYGVALFYSTNWAIRAEKLALNAGFQVKLVPTPRQLSADCGTALRFDWPDRDRLTVLLEDNEIAIEQVAKL